MVKYFSRPSWVGSQTKQHSGYALVRRRVSSTSLQNVERTVSRAGYHLNNNLFARKWRSISDVCIQNDLEMGTKSQTKSQIARTTGADKLIIVNKKANSKLLIRRVQILMWIFLFFKARLHKRKEWKSWRFHHTHFGWGVLRSGCASSSGPLGRMRQARLN